MNSALITGCNRGIGLGLVKYLLQQQSPPKHVIATCRSKQKAETLVQLANGNQNLHILEIDLKNYNQYQRLADEISQIVQEDGLNLLVNSAGVTTKFTRIGQVKLQQMTDNLMVNTIAPVMLTKACVPLLKRASVKNSTLAMGIHRAAVINISSILGSIALNTEGGFYPYRASKTALNACTKSLSIDLKPDQIFVASLHPGWIKTDMGGKNAPLELDAAVQMIMNTLKNLSTTQNGQFIQYDGSPLAW